jgi:hypothetical protein
MKKYLIIFMLLFICACSSSQPIPQWKDTASRQLENYKTNFLTDKEDADEPHFIKARNAIASNNDLQMLAKAYLIKYALHTAVLEDFDDSDFLRIDKLEPNAANRAYYDLLKGNISQLNEAKLKPVYQKLLRLMRDKNLSVAAREISSIDDPLSRLIACGIWVKYMPYNEDVIKLAINTASQDGWKKPLWAYLTKLQKYYLDRQETDKAETIKERLELLKK